MTGMAWLSLAMDVHWKQVCPSARRSRRSAGLLRTLGWAALAASLAFCLLADTATMAVLVWMMLLAVSAATIALVMSRRPAILAPFAALGGGAAGEE
jgi:hypothetical protein